MKKKIYGQDEIIDSIVETIHINKAGLSDPTKPIASFLFTGPTGVGKTEMVKELSENLGIIYNKIDMSEYMEKHSVSKLIGAAPGYVGYEEGGTLIEMIKKNPHSIILFDEIEKAHPSVTNVLLQMLEDGELTDNTGYKANLKNTIIILTSNLGTKNTNKISFVKEENSITEKTNNAIKSYFPPEIINRLDLIVEFKHLEKESILKIVDKNINLLNQLLKEKKVEIKVSIKAKEYIADQGYDKSMGARPIAREFNKLVKPRITQEILFGELKDGGLIEIGLKSNELSFNIKK
jgi:ATP-dependent Clp protease ATP-binding subunit ClpA